MGGDGNDPFPWLLVLGWAAVILAPVIVLAWIILFAR